MNNEAAIGHLFNFFYFQLIQTRILHCVAFFGAQQAEINALITAFFLYLRRNTSHCLACRSVSDAQRKLVEVEVQKQHLFVDVFVCPKTEQKKKTRLFLV